jgi:hypothetical protein
VKIAISEVAEIRTGYQVREGLQATSNGTHLVVQAKDIDDKNDHLLITENLDRLTPSRDASPYLIRNGDVLFLSRGRRQFATLVEGLLDVLPTVALYYFFILRPKAGLVDPAYLAWVINETDAQEYLARVSSGTTMPFVTKRSFSSLEVEIPTIERQISIGKLHGLARRERMLLRRLEQQRSSLVQSVCRTLCEPESNT